MPKKSGLINQRELEICARFKKYRETIKWPQPAFAYELGLTKDQLASIEYGRTPLRYETGYRLCRLFDINAAWLATGQGVLTPFDPNLIWPGNLPNKILFSEAYDSAIGQDGVDGSRVIIKTKSGAERESRFLRYHSSDSSSFLVRKILDILDGERFRDPKERELFADEVLKIAQQLAFKYRKNRIKDQVKMLGMDSTAGSFDRKTADLSRKSISSTKEILRLKRKIDNLQAKIYSLEAGDDEPKSAKNI